jgi:signal peptidase I
MTEAPAPRSRYKLRITALIAAILLSVIAASIGWVTLGDTGGCSAEMPSVFSRLYHISSEAMQPEIEPGDWIWAERRFYCLQAPARGDLAVLAVPSRPETIFVERVIGLPGDRVQLQQGQLYLNGEPVRRDWVESAIHTGEGGDTSQRTRYMEMLPGERRYAIDVADPEGPLENTGEVTVPDGQYFVLGDNRDRSEDSRSAGFGLVPRGAIADRPAMVLWSGDRNRIGLRLDAAP